MYVSCGNRASDFSVTEQLLSIRQSQRRACVIDCYDSSLEESALLNFGQTVWKCGLTLKCFVFLFFFFYSIIQLKSFQLNVSRKSQKCCNVSNFNIAAFSAYYAHYVRQVIWIKGMKKVLISDLTLWDSVSRWSCNNCTLLAEQKIIWGVYICMYIYIIYKCWHGSVSVSVVIFLLNGWKQC